MLKSACMAGRVDFGHPDRANYSIHATRASGDN